MNTVYTVITGNYDQLKPPRVISQGWDYVVFSDKFLDVPPWNCTITEKHNREIKIKAEDLYKGLTLYVDGSIEIIGDLNQFCSEVPNWYTAWRHPHRTTVKQEAKAVIRLKGCDPIEVNEMMARYKRSGFKEMGLAACGVLLRDLSNPMVRKINNIWYNEWLNGPGRDQLSFMYAFFKAGYQPDLFDNETFNKYFKWGKHL